MIRLLTYGLAFYGGYCLYKSIADKPQQTEMPKSD